MPTDDKNGNIRIKNIYYMLSYAFRVLKHNNYDSVKKEPFQFDNIQDLLAEILYKGAARQVKQGLYREYAARTEPLSVMRGRLDISGTIRNKLQRKQKLTCNFDELSKNNLLNQILKTTIHNLIVKGTKVKPERKDNLRKVLIFFEGIDLINPASIRWNSLHYQRNNRNYELLVNICRLVLEGMLPTTTHGEYKMEIFSDEKMSRLYEKFILGYYCHHYPKLNPQAHRIIWNLTDGSTDKYNLLPIMKTDVVLQKDNKTLILDAKYYDKSKILQEYQDGKDGKLRSNHLYQIFAYVKNWEANNPGENVAGMLVYAKTQEEDLSKFSDEGKCIYTILGNTIGAVFLDLDQDFTEIAKQLDSVWKYVWEEEIAKSN